MGKYIILMISIDDFVITYVITGDSYFAQKRISEFVQLIHSDDEMWNRIINAFHLNKVISKSEFPEIYDLVEELFIAKPALDYIEF